jgi:predicted nucleic acid-binding protein
MLEKVARQTVNLIEQFCYRTTENAVYRISPDPKDNYLFDLAVQFNCQFIISDDTELPAFSLKPVPVKSTNWFFKNFPV